MSSPKDSLSPTTPSPTNDEVGPLEFPKIYCVNCNGIITEDDFIETNNSEICGRCLRKYYSG